MHTASLRDEIRSLEAHILGVAAKNLTARRTFIHSAVVEDGRVSENGVVSPWRGALRTVRYHADIDWRSTIWNAVALFGIGKFGELVVKSVLSRS